MSELLNKSKQNIASASLLKDNNFHAASVHCSYYAALQKMSDILCENFDYTPEKLFEECQRNATGSHRFIQNKIFLNLTEINCNFSQMQHFKGMMEDFTRKRVDADYKSIVIDSSKSGAAIAISNKIISTLVENFEKP